MPRRLVVVGAGGHAKMVLEAIRAQGVFEPVGLVDPSPPAPMVLGVPVIGGEEVLPRLRAEGVDLAFVAIGENALRARVGAALRDMGFGLATILHPSSVLLPSAAVGKGVAVMPRAVIGAEARVDDLAIVNTAAVVEHDGLIGAAAHVGPGATLAGAVRVGARALVGVGSAVRPGVTIGEGAIIGAGSAVVADVPAGAVLGGAPARPLGRWGGGSDQGPI